MNDKLKVNINEYLPLRDVVFNTLRQAIITGEFAPGERLMEIVLAERLGVSRTPVREAIRKLELEGLVVMVPRKGAEVASITEDRLKEVLEIRCALEKLGAVLSCQRITEEGREQLKKAHEEFVESVKQGDILDIATKDEAFHECIFELTGNQRLVQIVNNLKEQMYRYRMEYVKDVANHGNLIGEHEVLLEAILSGNESLAEETMNHHIHTQEEVILKNIHQQEEEKTAKEAEQES
ncbi:MAG: GntR family transcriptional regulator [Lachnospiraceae bacterium]|nr:GntR family transcriptional regulator [Lachnospiraceae bacterium]